jgi:hypothetical protein
MKDFIRSLLELIDELPLMFAIAGLIWFVIFVIFLRDVLNRMSLTNFGKFLWLLVIIFIPVIGMLIYGITTWNKSRLLVSITFFAIIFTGIDIWYFTKYSQEGIVRDVSDEDGIKVTAAELVNDFKKDEAAATKKYTDDKDSKKAVEITGEVFNVEVTSEGNLAITLKSDDPTISVYAALIKSEKTKPNIGDKIVIKGVCTGLLSDVTINEAVIVK